MPGVVTTPKEIQLPVGTYITSTGTWTRVTNSGLPYYSKTAAAETAKVVIPVAVDKGALETGTQLTSIAVPVRVATANLVSVPTATLYRRKTSLAVAGAGTNMTASSVTGTVTGAKLTAAATDRLLTFTITTPGWDYSYDPATTYNLELSFHAATTTAIRVYDAVAYYSVPS
jgi:hypothetical protein